MTSDDLLLSLLACVAGGVVVFVLARLSVRDATHDWQRWRKWQADNGQRGFDVLVGGEPHDNGNADHEADPAPCTLILTREVEASVSVPRRPAPNWRTAEEEL